MGDGEYIKPKPVYDIMLDKLVMLTNLFSSINPIRVRYEKAVDVFRLLKRTIIHNAYLIKSEKKDNDVIVRPAKDDWF